MCCRAFYSGSELASLHNMSLQCGEALNIAFASAKFRKLIQTVLLVKQEFRREFSSKAIGGGKASGYKIKFLDYSSVNYIGLLEEFTGLGTVKIYRQVFVKHSVSSIFVI